MLGFGCAPLVARVVAGGCCIKQADMGRGGVDASQEAREANKNWYVGGVRRRRRCAMRSICLVSPA
eukprot:scaffold11193_cov73-Skeletonema_dohrnii-CCMP3373.AAC.2